MNVTALQHFWCPVLPSERRPEKERFRAEFQRSLRSCVNRGFTVEEAFGMIWVETWEEISITEEEQSELYEELICWAKSTLSGRESRASHVVHKTYSRPSVAL